MKSYFVFHTSFFLNKAFHEIKNKKFILWIFIVASVACYSSCLSCWITYHWKSFFRLRRSSENSQISVSFFIKHEVKAKVWWKIHRVKSADSQIYADFLVEVEEKYFKIDFKRCKVIFSFHGFFQNPGYDWINQNRWIRW